jgi:hypothetical protein
MCVVRIIMIGLICLAAPLLAAAQSDRYTLQIEAAPTQAEAETKVSQLKARGVEAYWLKSDVPGVGVRYRVRVGRFTSKAAALRYGEQLRQQGLAVDYFVTYYELPARLPDVTQEASLPPSTAPATLKTAPTPKPASPLRPSPAPSPSTLPPGYTRFEDKAIGYSFAHPSYWTGSALGAEEMREQRIDSGAAFKSPEDAAFLSAVWNTLEGANSLTHDNDLIVRLIIQSMGSSSGTQSLTETARRVITEGGQIKTFVELRALFREPRSAAPLDFLGKAVIIRAGKGILLVTVFYSKDGPPHAAQVAERIIHSARAPE